MVYDKETLQPCHRLTEAGQKAYMKMLEETADEILFRHTHPFRYMLLKLKEMLGLD